MLGGINVTEIKVIPKPMFYNLTNFTYFKIAHCIFVTRKAHKL